MKTTKQSSVSRSEALRQKRGQRSQQRVMRASSTARQPHSYQSTTVLSRDAVMGRPMLQRTSTPLRRRVSVPYNNGTELLLRNIPVIRPGWRLFSGTLAIFLLCMIVFLSNTPRLQVDGMDIQGIERVTRNDIQAVVDLEGKTSYTITPRIVEDQLKRSFPELAEITVTVLPPNQVTIQVVERKPIIAWTYEDEKVVWIDNEGAMFPPRGEVKGLIKINSETAPPTYQPKNLTGEENAATSEEEDAAQQEISIGAGNFREVRVEPIILETSLKLKEMLPDGTKLAYSWSEGMGWHDNDWEVYVGLDLNDMDAKMKVYKALVNHLEEKGIQPGFVSVQIPESPYYRTE